MSAMITTTRPRVKPSRRFGVGILATRPSYRLDCTLEDDAWWAEESRREEDRMFDRLAAESAAMDRLENGLEPW